jgi:cephalosporin hydroxylase
VLQADGENLIDSSAQFSRHAVRDPVEDAPGNVPELDVVDLRMSHQHVKCFMCGDSVSRLKHTLCLLDAATRLRYLGHADRDTRLHRVRDINDYPAHVRLSTCKTGGGRCHDDDPPHFAGAVDETVTTAIGLACDDSLKELGNTGAVLIMSVLQQQLDARAYRVVRVAIDDGDSSRPMQLALIDEVLKRADLIEFA